MEQNAKISAKLPSAIKNKMWIDTWLLGIFFVV